MSKNDPNIVEDIVDLTSKLPWWAGCILAVLSHVLIRPFAHIDFSPTVGGGEGALGFLTPGFMADTLVGVFATFGQYVMPALFMIGALCSVIVRSKQKRALNVARKSGVKGINQLNWREFELLMEAYFRQEGYRVIGNSRPGPDGGVDLTIAQNGEKIVVQCKHWKSQPVGVGVVREIYGVMVAEGATKCMVVTSGKFTQEAVSFSNFKPILLVDGADLERVLRETPMSELSQGTAIGSPGCCPTCGNRVAG